MIPAQGTLLTPFPMITPSIIASHALCILNDAMTHEHSVDVLLLRYSCRDLPSCQEYLESTREMSSVTIGKNAPVFEVRT